MLGYFGFRFSSAMRPCLDRDSSDILSGGAIEKLADYEALKSCSEMDLANQESVL
jgi:hypothetical protein